jgi:glycosyltransferase involved in cell wall biosynthesis
MKPCMDQVLAWNPDFVIVQHEFGIFPKAPQFLQMLQMLDRTKYAITLHSVYQHLDKTICTSAIKNIIVHSQQGKECLRRLGHEQNIFVVPHGCIQYKDVTELWNIFQVPYVLVQFGFGFFYKGVDRAIEAVSILKKQEKFKDIYYVYLCSDSGHFDAVHTQYYSFLLNKIKELGVEDNVSIIRKYHTEETINNYLRTAKIALFPYRTDPNHVVYGASGALRVAMANGIPVIASESHMFDDLEGILPRPDSPEKLAWEIDEIFSNDQYRDNLKKRINDHIQANTWDIIADKYLEVYQSL